MRAPAFWWRDRDGPASLLLAPAAAFWRRSAEHRLAQPPLGRLSIPVICVGNPTVGGAGKTPAAIAIAAIVAALDKAPFFLTRGYKGRLGGNDRRRDRSRDGGPVLVDLDRHTADDVGDEALLLARHAPTVVAADRVAGGSLAYERGADVVIMDDGFHNPGLAKTASILVVDGAVGVGNGRVVPAGPLRAPLAAHWPLTQALVVVGYGAAGDRVSAEASANGVPVWRAHLVGRAPQLVGRRVVAFAGIGRPAKFFETLREIGAEIVGQESFPDHHRFAEADATALLEMARAREALPATTEKDAARLAHGEGAIAALRDAAVVVPAKLVFEEPEPFAATIGAMIAARRAEIS